MNVENIVLLIYNYTKHMFSCKGDTLCERKIIQIII